MIWGQGAGRVAGTLWRSYLNHTVVPPSCRCAFMCNCITDFMAIAARPENGLKKRQSMFVKNWTWWSGCNFWLRKFSDHWQQGPWRVCARKGCTSALVPVRGRVLVSQSELYGIFMLLCFSNSHSSFLCVLTGHGSPQHGHSDRQNGVCTSQGGCCAGGWVCGRCFKLHWVQVSWWRRHKGKAPVWGGEQSFHTFLLHHHCVGT